MNVLLQRHCARYIYVVPEGLRELMSDISREVIRSQPENPYLFIADYLDALIITRENARVAARLVQNITEITTTTVEFLQQTGMDRAEADHIVSIIQKAFKKHIEIQPGELPPEIQSEEVEEANIISDIINEANISPEEGEEAALIIQRAFRQFKLRKEKEKELLSGMVDWRAAARSAILLYRHTGVTIEEANRAATMIKAAYKGYYTRRLIRQLADEGKFLERGSLPVDAEDESNYSVKSYKAVTINYETVIPHVDFDETKALSESETTSSGAVVASTLEGILETAFLRSEETEVKLTQLESIEGGELPYEIKAQPQDETGEYTEVSETTGGHATEGPSSEEHQDSPHRSSHRDSYRHSQERRASHRPSRGSHRASQDAPHEEPLAEASPEVPTEQTEENK